MTNPKIKMAVRAGNYSALHTLAVGVVQRMTSNSNFVTPSPSLATIEAATATMLDAMTAWGTAGHHGSKSDLVSLQVAATELRNLLVKEAAYIMNLVDLSSSPVDQEAFLLSSGFSTKKERSPQGVLPAVSNLRQVISNRVDVHWAKLKWEKPVTVSVISNVKVYLIYRSKTVNFSDASFIGCSTKTSYIDKTPVLGATNVYFVVAFNNAGYGVPSREVEVSVPF